MFSKTKSNKKVQVINSSSSSPDLRIEPIFLKVLLSTRFPHTARYLPSSFQLMISTELCHTERRRGSLKMGRADVLANPGPWDNIVTKLVHSVVTYMNHGTLQDSGIEPGFSSWEARPLPQLYHGVLL